MSSLFIIILTIVNNATMNIECVYLFKLVISFSLDKYQGMKLLDHIVILFLFIYFLFEKPSILFFRVVALIYILTNSVIGFPFLHISLTFVICRPFNDNHSEMFEVMPHCGFNMHFLDD